MLNKLVIYVGALSLPLAASAQEDISNRTAGYYRTVGRLVPEYVSNLACAEEQIGMRPINELKENVKRHFGDEMVARVQADYDRIRRIVEETPPSERPQIVRSMRCIEEAERLAAEIEANWEDGVWSANRQ